MGFCNLRARWHPVGILLALFCFSACGWETPRRVQVSAAMGLHVPLGDIGNLEAVQDALENLDIDNLFKDFSEEGQQVTVYYYTGECFVPRPVPDPDNPDKDSSKNAEGPYTSANALNPLEIRTLLIHFPLTSIDLNFAEYLKSDDVTMPDVVLPDSDFFPLEPGDPIPGEGFKIDPIPLGAMNEWIQWVDINDEMEKRYTKVIVKGGASLQPALKLAIPKLGIGKDDEDYQFGTPSYDGLDLVFQATYPKTLKPKEDIVNVSPLLVRVPDKGESDGHYSVDIDLQWTKAEVHPGDIGDYRSQINLPLGQFAEVLAKYKMITLPHYLYVGGPFSGENTAEIGLKQGEEWIVGDAAIIIDEGYPFQELYPLSPGDPYKGPLSYTSTASFNLADKVNNISGDLLLDYWIQVKDDWVVKYEEVKEDTDTAIRVDLVALLPMSVRLVEEDEQNIYNYDSPCGRKTFIRLMEMSDFGLDSGSDLFGRDQAELSGTRITSIRISGQTIRNTIFAGDLFLRMYDGVSLDKLVKINIDNDFSIDITGNPDIPNPFCPKFAVYLKATEESEDASAAESIKPKGKSAVVDIKRKEGDEADGISMKLVAEVTGEIEYEQDL
jgi:hypothetical protein